MIEFLKLTLRGETKPAPAPERIDFGQLAREVLGLLVCVAALLLALIFI